MARSRRYSRRRRRGRFGGLYRIFAVLAVVAALIAASVIFFRVDTVTVTGNSRYTVEEIIDASGIEMGDNLIALPKSRISSAIRTELPYVETVSVRRDLPNGVEITVQEQVAAATVNSSSGRWLISSQGKLLEQLGGQSAVRIEGLTAVSPYAGGMLKVADEDANTLSYVLTLLTAMEEKGLLSKGKVLDCTPATYMTLTWDIYTLKFPRGGDYAYMIRLLESALEDERTQNVPGTFDFTTDEGKLRFRADN